ncbi:helix-turn-helix domain-containing protein [Pseudomonas sp. P1.8]|jgi:hypothetical protein|uniref:helix-turn-helix domain-containing protein n=1 Tax=Pseudomonas sp. P1.8 TaxID=1699310 RepID=UPI000A98D623|nr:helix-turn-helix domain-containing protein [Pseudomonas sp. P1.8]
MTKAITPDFHNITEISFEDMVNMYREDISKSLGYDPIAPPVLIDDKQAAHVLDVSPNTLSIWRSLGRYNIPFVKSGRLVRYRVDDLARFLARRTVTHTGKIV